MINYKRIPSEPRGYTVWYTYETGWYMLGTVRPDTLGWWKATFEDGRGPNVLSGDTMSFRTRRAAGEWLYEISQSSLM